MNAVRIPDLRPDGVVRRVENACIALSAAALVLMATIMVVEVTLRYLLGAPLSWSLSFISDYLLVGMFFLGVSFTYRVGGHVRIDTLHSRLPERIRHRLDLIGNVLSLLFVALLCYAGITLTGGAWVDGEIPPPGGAELSWPSWTSYVLVPIGSLILASRLFCTIVASRSEES